MITNKINAVDEIYILMQHFMFIQTLPWANVTFQHTYFVYSDVPAGIY